MADFLKPSKSAESHQTGSSQVEQEGVLKQEQVEENFIPDAETAKERLRESGIEQDAIAQSQEEPERSGRIISLESSLKETVRDKSHLLLEIEESMSTRSEKMVQLYGELDDEDKKKAVEEGEKAAKEIENLVEESLEEADEDYRVLGRKIVGELRGWMKNIPGVNRYFLEQESKLIADEILAVARKAAHPDQYKEAA